MRRYWLAAAVCGGLVATADAPNAQELLRIPVSTRVTSMGENGVADNSDPGTIYINPANVVGPARVYVQGSGWDYGLFGYYFARTIPLRGGSAGGSFRLGSGASPLMVGVDVSYGSLDYGEYMVYSPYSEPLGTADWFEKYWAVAIGVGDVFDNGLDVRVGAAVRRWWAEYPIAQFTQDDVLASVDALAFDIGTTFALHRRLSDWTVVPAVAVAIVNMGSDIDFGDETDPLPRRLNFGTSVRFESPTTRIFSADVPVFTFVANVEGTDRVNDQPFSWGLGMEMGFAQIIFLRAGSISYPDKDYLDNSGLGFGVGFPTGPLRVRFDYGHDAERPAADQYGGSLSWLL